MSAGAGRGSWEEVVAWTHGDRDGLSVMANPVGYVNAVVLIVGRLIERPKPTQPDRTTCSLMSSGPSASEAEWFAPTSRFWGVSDALALDGCSVTCGPVWRGAEATDGSVVGSFGEGLADRHRATATGGLGEVFRGEGSPHLRVIPLQGRQSWAACRTGRSRHDDRSGSCRLRSDIEQVVAHSNGRVDR